MILKCKDVISTDAALPHSHSTAVKTTQCSGTRETQQDTTHNLRTSDRVPGVQSRVYILHSELPNRYCEQVFEFNTFHTCIVNLAPCHSSYCWVPAKRTAIAHSNGPPTEPSGIPLLTFLIIALIENRCISNSRIKLKLKLYII